MTDIKETGGAGFPQRYRRFRKPGDIAPAELVEPAELAARPILREADLLAAVIDMAGWLKWRAYHPRYSIQSARGWPDLVLCKPPRLLFVELKTDGRTPGPYQLDWLDALRQCGAEATVWWTADWHSGEVERVLKGGRTDDAPATQEDA